MDKLLYVVEYKNFHHFSDECEQKFNEVFVQQAPQSIRVEQYADKEETSGAFRLSTLVEMDIHLMKDSHFQEMVQDIARYCSSQYIKVYITKFLILHFTFFFSKSNCMIVTTCLLVVCCAHCCVNAFPIMIPMNAK